MIDIMIQANPLMWSFFYVYKIYANRLKEILLASDRKWSMFLPWGFDLSEMLSAQNSLVIRR